ncbi:MULTISPECIES: methyltransferase [Okeania]|uniref:Methyltransferase domain-containing protein n=1 Tax=Okeania hirsuta TaxID=1458930 RepID=A0A3N6PSC3_9CYAN|nr:MULTISPECIES: methyltransferase [Okeania]NEP40520.1 methyltransferase domain-containing protein [Okeania sp. SIO2H7]NET12366.1 methyltransferase domain-containing protein [Okeania sp. SIO1H6]NEP71961.1 methyltransferase domain-containing protein [Okeania sp. SIO2G5]NEP92994.1 methyltransferase domain-containing protein [Okeania sp. SIO2F5]NEQ90662.1 methyltransferase domain-containing protein [Okeania sp. SIO2G4]
MLGSASESKKKIYRIIYGYWQSQCVYVATNLGIPELLHNGQQTVEAIAEKTGTKVEKLYVVLRALAHLGVFLEKPGRVFASTELSELLITNGSPSIGDFLMHITEPNMWDGWRELENSLKTGEVPFELAKGKDFYTSYMTENPKSKNLFNNAMSYLTTEVVDPLFAVYDFGRFQTVMDVGGNQGTLIANIVKRFGCKGILFDLPHEVETAPNNLAKHGVNDAVTVIGGSALESLPKGADAIVMKYFLSVFSREDSIKVLTNCREALSKDGRVILLQTLVPSVGAPVEYPDGTIPALAAVQMMITNPGGYWRTEQEYKDLFAASGFQLEQIVHTGTSVTVMEFSPL